MREGNGRNAGNHGLVFPLVGFIAAILASSLKARYCLDFAGQFSLLHHWTHVDTNPFLKELYSKNGHCFGEAYMYLGGLQYIILNQPYVSKTLNKQMQKCALMLKFSSPLKNAWMCYISPVALRKVMSYDVEQPEKLYQSVKNKMKSIVFMVFSEDSGCSKYPYLFW